MNLRQRIIPVILLAGIIGLTMASAFAETRGNVVAIRYTLISPLIAVMAGILILIIPRLLNYIVAIYLILVGLIGIFGR